MQVELAKLELIKSTQDYIEVNGVKVAKGNLVANGENGARIGKPTDGGLYFQFGSLVGWSTTGSATIAVKPTGYTGSTTWNSNWTGDPSNENVASGTGDPCKYYLGGTWRLPTNEEFKTIMNGVDNNTLWGSVDGWGWRTSPTGVIHDTGLFFPASGCRNNSSGDLNFVDFGIYWSASPASSTHGYILSFTSSIVYPQYTCTKPYGIFVRCVQEYVQE